MAIPYRYQKIINQSAEDYYDEYDEVMIEDLYDEARNYLKNEDGTLSIQANLLADKTESYLDGILVDDIDEEDWCNLMEGYQIPFSQDAKDDWLAILSDWKGALPDPGAWAGEQAYAEYENAMEER